MTTTFHEGTERFKHSADVLDTLGPCNRADYELVVTTVQALLDDEEYWTDVD